MDDNVMVVKVKYWYGGYTLSTDRFTYEGVRDMVKVNYNYGGDISKVKQAAEWLEERGHKVIGVDGFGSDVGYVIVGADENKFKSISGKHENKEEK